MLLCLIACLFSLNGQASSADLTGPNRTKALQKECFIFEEFKILDAKLNELAADPSSQTARDLADACLQGLITRLRPKRSPGYFSYPEGYENIFAFSSSLQWYALILTYEALAAKHNLSTTELLLAVRPQLKAMLALQFLCRHKDNSFPLQDHSTSFLVSDGSDLSEIKRTIAQAHNFDLPTNIALFAMLVQQLHSQSPQQLIAHPEAATFAELTKWLRTLISKTKEQSFHCASKNPEAIQAALIAQADSFNLGFVGIFPAHILTICALQLQACLLLM